jgi:hypothetical protein
MQVGLLATWVCAGAPAGAGAQTISGRVLEEGRGTPVSGARVLLLNRDEKRQAETLADSLGRFVIAPPRDGEFVLAAERLGYETARTPLLALTRAGTAQLDLTMRAQPIGLEGFEVSVEPELVRELRTLGHTPESLGRRWISRQDIEAVRAAVRTSDVIRWRSIPGVYLPVTNQSPMVEPLCVTTQRAGNLRSAIPPCAITVLNGMRVDPVEANQMDPSSIEAIAVLSPMDATTLFGTQGGGGAVLIWTRRGGG